MCLVGSCFRALAVIFVSDLFYLQCWSDWFGPQMKHSSFLKKIVERGSFFQRLSSPVVYVILCPWSPFSSFVMVLIVHFDLIVLFVVSVLAFIAPFVPTFTSCCFFRFLSFFSPLLPTPVGQTACILSFCNSCLLSFRSSPWYDLYRWLGVIDRTTANFSFSSICPFFLFFLSSSSFFIPPFLCFPLFPQIWT